MTRRRGIAYLLMLGIIVKHLLSREYGPIDRLVELGVFVLIAYEVIINAIRHRREFKHKKRIRVIVKEISKLIDEGRDLQAVVPYALCTSLAGESGQDLNQWVTSITAWRRKVEVYFESRSQNALHVFSIITNAHQMDSLFQTQRMGKIALTGMVRETYQELSAQLSNLGKIVEQPEAYFEAALVRSSGSHLRTFV